MRRRSTLASLPLSLLLGLPACSKTDTEPEPKPKPGVVHREGQPDFFRVPDEDKAMDMAIEKARSTVDTFVAALKAPTKHRSSFAIKKPFAVDGGGSEHIWLSDVKWTGDAFSGRVDNDPVDAKGVKLGDTITVPKREISDWSYVDDGKLVGGYTLRVLYERMSPDEKKEFVEHIEFAID